MAECRSSTYGLASSQPVVVDVIGVVDAVEVIVRARTVLCIPFATEVVAARVILVVADRGHDAEKVVSSVVASSRAAFWLRHLLRRTSDRRTDEEHRASTAVRLVERRPRFQELDVLLQEIYVIRSSLVLRHASMTGLHFQAWQERALLLDCESAGEPSPIVVRRH